MKKFVGFVRILWVLFGMVNIAEATDIYVPGNYTTIRSTVNVAITGDTI